MILSFLTQIKGKPTHFPEKILGGLFENQILNFGKSCDYLKALADRVDPSLLFNALNTPVYKGNSKLHTIREDKANRWKPGVMIDFFINSRKPDMFRFAPKIPVKSVQDIEMKFIDMHPLGWDVEIIIDGKLLSYNEEELLAKNDGFENFDEFSNYFLEKGETFKGKIIQWTDLKY